MNTNLPQSPESHDQERTSQLKFKLLVPTDQFIVRQELGGDYGVDLILELKLETKFVSNFRTHVQLKSVHKGERNKDSTFSFPVPISTLNYLLNQPNSIFVVYLENEEVFLWDWCTNIFRYSKSKDVDITQTEQGTISYRFQRTLGWEAFREIHQKILSNSEMIRDLVELAPSRTDGHGNTMLFLHENKVVDLDNLSQQLKQFGYDLIYSGEINFINDVLDKFPNTYKHDVEFALFASYAKFNHGKVLEALSWLPSKSTRGHLSKEDKVFCERLELSIHFSLGLIDSTGYTNGSIQIEKNNPESIITLQIKLERLKRSLFSTSFTQAHMIFDEMGTIAKKLIMYPNIHHALKFEATCALWEVEGYKLVHNFWEIYGKKMLVERLNFKQSQDALYESVQQLLHAKTLWFNQFMEFRQRALKDKNVIGLGKLLCTFAYIELPFFAVMRSSMASQAQDIPQQLEFICQEIENISQILLKIGAYPIGLRLKLLEAEALEGRYERTKALTIAHEIKHIAEQLGFPEIEKYASEFIDGSRLFQGYKLPFFDELHDSSVDTIESEGDIEHLASFCLKAYNLPDDRLKWIKKDFEWDREDDNEKRVFCKYIGTLQNLSHKNSYETFYKQVPPRIATCTKFGHRSSIESTYRKQLLKAFKGRFCVECSAKET